MELKSEVCIISVFGRGHWLASELGKRGISVVLLEISGQMGNWAPEDWEGPFGFFKSDAFTETQIERLFEDENSQIMSHGLTIWLKSGPVELKGPGALHRLKQLDVPQQVIDYINGQLSVEQLRNFSFSQAWLAHLSHAYSANTATLLPETFKEGKRQNLFSNFYSRSATRVGIDKSLQGCQAAGVKTIKNVRVIDLSFKDRKTLEGLEIKIDRQEIFKAEQFVWCLTSEETGMLNMKIQNHLFPKGGIEPDWVWMRYRIKVKSLSPAGEAIRFEVPLHTIIIEDLLLPWTHENYILLVQTASSELYDAWIRIPQSQRFNKVYIEEKAQAICQILEERIPDNQVQVTHFPQEHSYSYGDLGPSRHPVFSRGKKRDLVKRAINNFYHDSPEDWKCLGWEGSMDHQQEVARVIQDWWREKEEIRLKNEAAALARAKGRDQEGNNNGDEL